MIIIPFQLKITFLKLQKLCLIYVENCLAKFPKFICIYTMYTMQKKIINEIKNKMFLKSLYLSFHIINKIEFMYRIKRNKLILLNMPNEFKTTNNTIDNKKNE